MSPRRIVVSAAGANACVALVVAVAYGSGGLVSVVAGIALAAAGTFAASAVGVRVAGAGFGAGVAVVYVVLPLAATAYFFGPYASTYRHDVLPTLLGVRSPAALGVGVAIAIVVGRAPRRALAAGGVAATVVAAAVFGLDGLTGVRNGLHETGWSLGLVEWLPVAGVLGVARRSPWFAAALGGWLAFAVLRAKDDAYFTGQFWRDLAPALPAAAVLVAAIALLVPRLRPSREPDPAPRDAT